MTLEMTTHTSACYERYSEIINEEKKKDERVNVRGDEGGVRKEGEMKVMQCRVSECVQSQ